MDQFSYIVNCHLYIRLYPTLLGGSRLSLKNLRLPCGVVWCMPPSRQCQRQRQCLRQQRQRQRRGVSFTRSFHWQKPVLQCLICPLISLEKARPAVSHFTDKSPPFGVSFSRHSHWQKPNDNDKSPSCSVSITRPFRWPKPVLQAAVIVCQQWLPQCSLLAAPICLASVLSC